MKTIAFILLLTMTTGCVMFYDAAGEYQKKIESWMDGDVNELIKAWGQPTDVFQMPNGDVMYSWNKEEYRATTGYYWGISQTRQLQRYCRTSFIVCPVTNIIKSATWEGNICR